MDLVDRLNIFIKSEGITPSMLADSCEIPRPTVSQLLNGRNKKISDDIIGRIHKVYPKLSVMWLMFGEGEMISKSNIEISEPQKAPISSVFDSQNTDSHQNTNSPQQENHADSPIQNNNPAFNSFMSMLSNPGEFNISSDKGEKQVISINAKKRITNIVVFYSDNSFEAFSPSQV